MLGWLIRILLAVLVVRGIWNFVSGLFVGAAESPKMPSRKSVPLVRDPVCGTYIDPSRALSAKTRTTVHYFCSENCRQAFRPSA